MENKKQINSKIICLLLSLILILSSIFFTACSFDDGDGENSSFFQQYIDSFKVVYSNSLHGKESSVKPLENSFFENVLAVESKDLKGLAYYYGSADEYAMNNPQWFPDSIRMLVIDKYIQDPESEEGELKSWATLILDNSKDISWKWTLDPGLNGNEIEDLKPLEEDKTYDSWKNDLWEKNLYTAAYSNTFTNMYLLPLKVVMYEILLGYEELSVFAPPTGNADSWVVKVKSSSNSSIINQTFINADGQPTVYESEEANKEAQKEVEDIDENDYLIEGALSDYIEFLRNSYLSKTKYTGFSPENARKMISYILNEVIGSELVNSDYINYGPSTKNTEHYKDIEVEESDLRKILGLGYDDNLPTFNDGEVVYDKRENPYNYLIYKGKNGEKYILRHYYNYRNYIERVSKMVFSQSYDGYSESFEYVRKITVNNQEVEVKYDYVKEHCNEKIGEGLLAKRSFSATPATFFNSFEGETFFEDMDSSFSFKNAPKAEYQSILMITNPKYDFEIEAGIGYNIIAYDKNLKVNITVRYYNKDIGKMYLFDCGQTDFSKAEEMYDTELNKMGFADDFEVGFDEKILSELPDNAKGKSSDGEDLFIIPYVENETYRGIQGAEINLGSDLGNSKYYQVIDSKNGYGGITVIDEREMDCSFYEIVFDTIKSPDDPEGMDYDFRITVSPFIY